MFGFGKKKKKAAPSWGNLTPAQKALVTKRIVKALQGGPRYKLVSGSDEWQRAAGQTEHGSEDEILSVYSRGRMIN